MAADSSRRYPWGDGDIPDAAYEDLERALRAYIGLFERLKQRAEQSGFDVTVIVSTKDPISGMGLIRSVYSERLVSVGQMEWLKGKVLED